MRAGNERTTSGKGGRWCGVGRLLAAQCCRGFTPGPPRDHTGTASQGNGRLLPGVLRGPARAECGWLPLLGPSGVTCCAMGLRSRPVVRNCAPVPADACAAFGRAWPAQAGSLLPATSVACSLFSSASPPLRLHLCVSISAFLPLASCALLRATRPLPRHPDKSTPNSISQAAAADRNDGRCPRRLSTPCRSHTPAALLP